MTSAKVHRIESIEEFERCLTQYSANLCVNLDELTASIRRLEQIFADEYPAYWRRQTQLSQQKLKEAEIQLARMQTTARTGDRRVAIEARQIVNDARGRLRQCEEKQSEAKHFAIAISGFVDKVLGPIGGARLHGETDLPAAAVQLRSIIASLRDYGDA